MVGTENQMLNLNKETRSLSAGTFILHSIKFSTNNVGYRDICEWKIR